MSKYSGDIEFVLSEIVRFARMEFSDLRALPREDHWSTMPHPTGHGHLICGAAAERRLWELVDTALARSAHAGCLDRQVILRELKNTIVDRFIKRALPLNPHEAKNAINAAVESAASSISDITHLIPCHLVDGAAPDSFSIGPVAFCKATIVLDRIEAALQAYLKEDEKEPERRQGIHGQLLSDARTYYGTFGWIAEVSISGCDAKTSDERAKAIVQNALDCFHLIIGASHSSRMRMGGPNYKTDRRSKIVIHSDGTADLSSQMQWDGNHLIDGWWETLNAKGADALIELMGVAIHAGYAQSKSAPLAQRFLDAAAWYGQAVRDRYHASQLIKYVTAIERIVTTKNEEFLAETIAKRGSALLMAGGVDKTNDHSRLKNVYNMRSKLVHGSRSPNELGLGNALWKAEELSRQIILSSLHFFGVESLQKPNYTSKMLDDDYAALITWAEDRVADGSASAAAQLNFGT